MTRPVDMYALHNDALKAEIQRLRQKIAELEAVRDGEVLLTADERLDFFDSMEEHIDALTIAAYVRDSHPAVFDAAAAHVGRIRANLAALHADQPGGSK